MLQSRAGRSGETLVEAIHSTDPAVVVGGLAAHVLEHLGMGQDQEAVSHEPGELHNTPADHPNAGITRVFVVGVEGLEPPTPSL